MIQFNTHVNFDVRRMSNKVRNALSEAQHALDQQAVKDSNYYIPKDTGELEASSLRASQIGKGILIWDTKYAKKLYYNQSARFSIDRNPHASALWFEQGKAHHKNEWVAEAKRKFLARFNS
ncbi:minor capsid protein [Bacillus thuringiensis]|uniref:minor capsid protein n=1 Tax=Bacillus thuringiensis TaxID=1428 RepID=UPI000BF35ED9|nr:minor capsid protein [Bacillus thuringiensis]PFD62320.1 minor capsid protein [Bacillus thuringiensis]PGK79636.1 minor capsid protein [Bacillus thuringiensis]